MECYEYTLCMLKYIHVSKVPSLSIFVRLIRYEMECASYVGKMHIVTERRRFSVNYVFLMLGGHYTKGAVTSKCMHVC